MNTQQVIHIIANKFQTYKNYRLLYTVEFTTKRHTQYRLNKVVIIFYEQLVLRTCQK